MSLFENIFNPKPKQKEVYSTIKHSEHGDVGEYHIRVDIWYPGERYAFSTYSKSGHYFDDDICNLKIYINEERMATLDIAVEDAKSTAKEICSGNFNKLHHNPIEEYKKIIRREQAKKEFGG